MQTARHILCLFALCTTASLARDLGRPSPEEQKLLARTEIGATNTATLYKLADIAHDLGVDGDKDAVERAEAYLRQLLASEPTNAPALALLGSVFTMKGRDAFWPTTQLRLVRQGNNYMDQAVQMAPDDIQTRVIRALNNTHMPDFLGRTETARKDLAWLWEKIEATPGILQTSSKQQVALHWGKHLKRLHKPEEARRVWEAGKAMDPESKAGSLISEELAKLR